MRVGIDFDNTIVSYESLFYAIAVERGFVARSTPMSKSAVRDAMRATGNEDAWTALQGEVYGRRILDAPPFPGVRDAIAWCRRAGFDVYIVSHKTQYPYRGPRVDLHAAAWDWLRHHDIVGDDGVAASHVHFCLTKDAKLSRIGELECDVFIDDLPDLLAEPAFPAATQPVLFDPNSQPFAAPTVRRLTAWSQLPALLNVTAEVSP